MTHIEIPITAYSVQSAHPARKYGQLARLPLLAGSSEVFFRASLTKIPAGATVTSAVVRYFGRTDESGSRTLKVQPTTTHVTSNIRWSKTPDSAGTTVTVTKASPLAKDAWDWAVTALVQEVVSGQRVDFGWRLWEDASTTSLLRLGGSTAPVRKPLLIVDYTTRPPEPDNLHPAGGAISAAKPTVTFDAVQGITDLQVQVDPAMNEATPAFDSGIRAAGGGMLDLAATTYAGLASGATTYWRARQKTGGGWSPWSDWVSMSRLVKPTLTLLNPPAGNTDDGTPPVQWSFAGTQTAWQARILNASGDVIADSGYTPGTDTDWAPENGLKRDGQSGVVEVLVWGNDDRVAAPGDPEYVLVTRSITYVLDPTVDPMSSLAASQSNGTPDVVLTGNRAAVPDEVVVFRDGVSLGTWTGTDLFTGSSFTFTDPNPPMARPVTYRVAPRVNGKTAKGGPEVTIVPFVEGIWVESVETGERVMLYVDGPGQAPEQAQPETSIVHTPLNEVDGAGQVVRRRLVRYRAQGTVAGVVAESPNQPSIPSAATCEALLREWADGDAGDLYWLAFSGFTGKVIIGDLNFRERDNHQQDSERLLEVSFNYWGQA